MASMIKLIEQSTTPTVTAGAYSASDVVGGRLTFTMAAASGVYLLKSVRLVDDAFRDLRALDPFRLLDDLLDLHARAFQALDLVRSRRAVRGIADSHDLVNRRRIPQLGPGMNMDRAMARLGLSEAEVRDALRNGFKHDGLPRELHFIIMGDADRDEHGDWLYPQSLSAGYEAYDKTGRFCRGDGENARRKQKDGSDAQIQCNPYGKEGVDPCDFCPFSGPGKPCKVHARLSVCLYVKRPGQKDELLSPRLGMQGRWRWDTSSEYAEMDGLDAFDKAANRVQGRINGLTGMLVFSRKGRRTGDGAAVVGHVAIMIDEESILRRERELREASDRMLTRRIEATQAGLMIEGPVQIADPFDAPIDAEFAEAAPSPQTTPRPAAVPPGNPPNKPKPKQQMPPAAEVEPVEVEPAEPDPLDAPLESEQVLKMKALATLLEQHALELGTKTDPADKVLQRLAEQVEPKLDGQKVTIDWFFGADGPRRARVRFQILEQICHNAQVIIPEAAVAAEKAAF